MDVFQPWILHLNLFVIFTLLIYADLSKTSVARILHQINQTAVVGDTVTLYCNNTEHNNTIQSDDISWKKNNANIFTQASFSNQTMRNFTSDRMYINPAVPNELKINQIQASDAGNYSCYTSTTAIGWILTVTVSENRSESLKQIPHLYIIISCTGVIIICLIISLTIWIHRTWKSNRDAGQRETGQDFSQTPARGGIQTHNSQYFERYNSLYGQV